MFELDILLFPLLALKMWVYLGTQKLLKIKGEIKKSYNIDIECAL